MNNITITTSRKINLIKGATAYSYANPCVYSVSNYSNSAPFMFIDVYATLTEGKTYTIGLMCKEVDSGDVIWGRLDADRKASFGVFLGKGYSQYSLVGGNGDSITGTMTAKVSHVGNMLCLTVTPTVSGNYYYRIEMNAPTSEPKPWTRQFYNFICVEGEEITYYTPDYEKITVPITAQAEHNQELMKADEIKLSWSDTVCRQLPMGSYVDYLGKRYYLYEPHQPITTDNVEYKYTPTFQSEIFRLNKTPFMLYTLENGAVTAVETDWNFTGDKEAIKIALEDAILRGIGVAYSVEISDEIDKSLVLSFSNVDIITALNNICSEWECEWWYDELIGGTSRTIYIGKSCIHGEALTLSDGVEVQGTTTKTQNVYYNRFYVFGSDRNIPQDYNGAQATQVVNKRLTLSPTLHPNGYIDLPKFDTDGNVLVDANGDYITDESVSSGMIFSKVITLEDVYPKSDLSVQSICTRTMYMRDDNDNIVYLDDAKTKPDTYNLYYLTLVDGVGDKFTINPSTYDKDKNPDGSLIKGKTLSIHMSSGALTGREFELIYHEKSETLKGDDGQSVTIPAHCFEVVFSQDNTVIIPNTNIAPVVGDKAIIFNIRMPQTYIDSAYRELEEKALLAIYDETRDKNAYTVKSNQVWFAQNNPQILLGRNILYVSGGRNIVTRVTKLVTKLDRPFEQSITLCKEISKGSISTIVEKIESTKKEVYEVSVKDDKAVQEATRKAFKAQRELQDMVFDTDGYFKDGNIKPETIETLMLSVGATSTNFALQNVLISVVENTLTITSNSGKLVHYGINADNIVSWNVSSTTATLTSGKAYYIYAQCNVSGTACNIVADTAQYKYNARVESNGVYMFLVGTVSTDRILSLTYGASTINGGQIKTGRISSNDGNTYFDLTSGEIGGNIKFKGTSDYTEILGDIAEVGSVANSAKTTANSANKNAQTANENANKAITTAEQVKDLTITAVDVEYASNQSTTTAPTSGWSTNAPAWKSGYYIWQRTATTYGAGTTEYSTPTCISGRNGVDGADGKDGTNGTNGKDGTNGTNGTDGKDGVGIKSIVEQYYLSTSSTTQSGGSWSTDQPAWASGKYIWTRSFITWNDGATAYTTPVLAKAINGANTTANTANTTANSANTTATNAQNTANTANNTANTAKTTAEGAVTAVNNLQVGGRNYLTNSATSRQLDIANAASAGTNIYSWEKIFQLYPVSDGIQLIRTIGTTLCVSADYEVLSCSVDNVELRLQIIWSGWGAFIFNKKISTSDVGKKGRIYGVHTITTASTATQFRLLALGATPTDDFEIIVKNWKLELGNKATDWTPAPEDVDAEIAAAQAKAVAVETATKYLTEAMTQGSTDINGGVVLTNVMQMKDSEDEVVAGVSGSANVRFWSGGTLAEALLGLANFVVNSEGFLTAIGAVLNNAKITSGDGANDIDISGGSISLKNDGTFLTQILAQSLGTTIDVGLGKFVSNLGTPTTASFNVLLSGSTNPLAYDYTGVTGGSGTNSIKIGLSGRNETTIFTASANGTLTFKANISTTQTIQTPSYTCTRADAAKTPITPSSVSWGTSPSVTIKVSVLDNYNNVVFVQSNSTVANKSFPVESGRTYRLRVDYIYNNYLTVTCANPGNLDLDNEGLWCLFTPRWNNTNKQIISIPTVAFNGTATAYNNKIFNDGVIMSSDADSYVAIAPKSTADIFRMRHGSAIYKLLANTGLVYNRNGGSSYYLANPIVLSFRVAYNSSTGKYNAVGAYNPKGLNIVCSGSGTALVVSHGYGNTLNVSVIVHGTRTFATLQAETPSSFTLNLGGNYDATITCIDPNTYTS